MSRLRQVTRQLLIYLNDSSFGVISFFFRTLFLNFSKFLFGHCFNGGRGSSWRKRETKKERRNIGIFTAKLNILCYDQRPTSLQNNGMAAIPKTCFLSKFYLNFLCFLCEKYEKAYFYQCLERPDTADGYSLLQWPNRFHELVPQKPLSHSDPS